VIPEGLGRDAISLVVMTPNAVTLTLDTLWPEFIALIEARSANENCQVIYRMESIDRL